MAIEKRKREDLLNEAGAYSRRVLLKFPLSGPACELFGGYRQAGGWSLYFDESPVLQFNAVGALRRLFVDERKFSAEGGRLIELERATRGGRVEHQRVQVSAMGERELLQRCLAMLRTANDALQAEDFELLGQVPVDDQGLLTDFSNIVASLSIGFPIASSATANG